jgi:hypothetical protein
MEEPFEKRGRWIAVVNGKRRKFTTKREALEALGVETEVQEEFGWLKSFTKGDDGSSDF